MEQGWNKTGHIPGDALEPFWGSGRAIWVCQRAPKRVQNGQKQPFWAISGSGGSKLMEQWNKGGSSQGTSPVMHWNSFAGQGGPSRGTRGLPKGSKTAFLAISGSGCPKKAPLTPVLKVDAHCAHVRRTKESWEDQKAG